MKQLKELLLFLSCIFLLPLLQGEPAFTSTTTQTVLQAHISKTTSDHGAINTTADVDGTLHLSTGARRYNHRTRALNDYHELCLFVPSIRIKSLFVYIHAVYKGYKESYISVAVTLSDWRGPPIA
ncbi:hypothetical protein [Chitinophaga sp. S165]|uniref:hypothetical protein n=1 Tax=Chitinophaga sp. S165 TaxID=2135462 RepID=UPI0011B516B6|nr:hypothetical protein [Chitinophaga sp. S165]